MAACSEERSDILPASARRYIDESTEFASALQPLRFTCAVRSVAVVVTDDGDLKKMHGESQTDTSAALVGALLAEQFPDLAGLPISRVDSAGTSNTIFRIGSDLVARFPLAEWAEPQVEKDHTWLARIAGHLPLEVPQPVAIGQPGQGFPWRWAIHTWIDGEPVSPGCLLDIDQAVDDLVEFLSALHSLDLPDAPASERNVPIDNDEELVLWAVRELGDEFDARVLERIWQDATAAPSWTGGPVLVHADLMNGNILARNGRIVAVIDWGLFGWGDPANDLDPAWELFEPSHRRRFRESLALDDATWARGRGWAVKSAVGVLYYRDTNPTMVNSCRRRLAAVVQDACGV